MVKWLAGVPGGCISVGQGRELGDVRRHPYNAAVCIGTLVRYRLAGLAELGCGTRCKPKFKSDHKLVILGCAVL
ncbi:uncharacterized protein BDV14DRAFT_181064 [Aspergillus stella-maris]|uniref:uncharacterized protein n=1 Tax=Aspergillus stella-maris TaxID=1810926 RepID=UPI003CCC95F0